MVRTQCSLKAAALEVGHPLDPDEADKVSRRRDFQEILRVEKNKFYASVANDPTRTKSVVLGQMWVLADRLIAEGEFEKAAGVLDKLSKMEGWSGNEGNINIFSGLTARDIAEAKTRIAGQREVSSMANKNRRRDADSNSISISTNMDGTKGEGSEFPITGKPASA